MHHVRKHAKLLAAGAYVSRKTPLAAPCVCQICSRTSSDLTAWLLSPPPPPPPSQLTGALSLFGGACTATSFVLQVSASAASYAASLRLSCPAVPSLTDVAASLSYANGAVSLDVTGSLSFLDGAVAVSQLSLSSTSAAAYVAGSCTGSVAGATGSLQFNLTKPTASVPVPKTSLALTIPNINFGTLASSLWATAAGQSLPSVLTSLTLPSVTIKTPDLLLSEWFG